MSQVSCCQDNYVEWSFTQSFQEPKGFGAVANEVAYLETLSSTLLSRRDTKLPAFRRLLGEASLKMVVRAHLDVTDKPLGKERTIFTGTLGQIKEDIAACGRIGAHELFLDPTFSPGGQSLDRWFALMEQLRKSV